MRQFTNTSVDESAVTDGAHSGHGKAALVIFESCIFVLLDLAALVGNLLVCLAFYRNHSLRRVTSYFIVSLALTDLAMAVLRMPLSISASIANKWITGEIGCKLSYFLGTVLAGTSLLTVMLVAVNRYLHVTQSTIYPRVYSKKYTILMTVSAWIIPSVVATSQYLASSKRFEIFLVHSTECFQILSHTSTSLTVTNNVCIAVPGLIILFCYVKIYQTIHHHRSAINKLSQRRHSVYGGVEERRVTKMLTVVVVGFFLCWLPLFVSNILRLFAATARSVIKFWHFCYLIPLFTSSAINPVIYATMSKPFRKEFLKILRAVLHCFS